VAVTEQAPAYHLTSILAVKAGQEPTLAGRLQALTAANPSPFARLPATHYVRLAPFDHLGANVPGEEEELLGGTYLLVSLIFDGDPDRYLVALARVCAQEVEGIFGCCEGWAGTRDLAAFAALVRGSERPALHRFGALPASAPHIRSVLDLRRRLIAFAVETQDLSAADLHEAYRKQFGSP
jgi:hypothetical protein